MKKENISIYRICHLVLIAIGFILFAFELFSNNSTVLDKTSFVLCLVALISSFIYLLNGYKKSADLYYKSFMWILGFSEIIRYTSILNKGNQIPAFRAFMLVMTFVSYLLIIGAKDYGKVKSNIVSVALVIFTLTTTISLLVTTKFEILNPIVLRSIGQVILALIVSLMVWVKYLDKQARGAK